ncbi:MAG: 2-dehydropantoate 2-reductase [Chloroflexi bacterium]|nr:2-dehydropantoate 2-reductase [Chloroflexota bacterium]
MPRVRVAIVGPGAMGCLFAALLAPHADVALLARRPAAAAALAAGFVVIEGDRTIAARVPATADPAAIGHVDVALVMTKAYDTSAAAERAAPLLGPDGLMVTVQNGLGNAEAVAAVVGPERTVPGVTHQGAHVVAPGRIVHAGFGPTYLGVRPETRARLDALAAALDPAGLRPQLVEDVQPYVWAKLLVNAAINPLTAILGVSNGAVVDLPAAAELAARVAGEVAAVAAAQGITLPGDPVALVRAACAASAQNRSSMLHDVELRRPTEIDAIAGAVARAGRAAGVATPTVEVLWLAMRAREEAYAIAGGHFGS